MCNNHQETSNYQLSCVIVSILGGLHANRNDESESTL